MSRFLSKATAALSPYVPGEQPRDQQYIKLNTNECPYPPSPGVRTALAALDTADFRLYPDPDVMGLREAMARNYGLSPHEVFAGAGSDEVLGYAFMAFFNQGDPVYFADITYGFYTVYAQLCGLQAVEIPLEEDFSLSVDSYRQVDGHSILANPNAPTGMVLTPAQIELLLKEKPNRLVIVDEAYIDFAKGKSCVPLIHQYDNLLVVQTFSKSRSLAGMRLGCGLGNKALIEGLNRIKFSFNPYNLDRAAIAAGIAAIEDRQEYRRNVEKIIATRTATVEALEKLGFVVLPSEANFLFIRHPSLTGEEIYRRLKAQGVLVRHFAKPRIADFVRVTIGTDAQMQQFITLVGGLL